MKNISRCIALLLFVIPASAQDYKEVYNDARAAAEAKDYTTAYTKYVEAASGADAAGDVDTARLARRVAAQIDNLRGTAAYKAGEFQKALDHFDKGIELNPGFIRNHYGRGQALNKLGRITEALDIWKEVMTNQDRKTALAAENQIRQHFEYQASSAISKKNPTRTDGERTLAVLDNYGQYLDPDANYHYYAALAHMALGDMGQSIASADQALGIHRGSRTDKAKIYYAKGEALLRSGNTAAAKDAFTNAAYGPHKASAEHYLESL